MSSSQRIFALFSTPLYVNNVGDFPRPDLRSLEYASAADTGGVYNFKKVAANSEIRDNSSYGVIKLTLKPGAYDWEFMPATGTFTDKGSGPCTPKP